MWNSLISLIVYDVYDFDVYCSYSHLINTPSNSDCYPLHFACISENANIIVPFLIHNDAKINVQNEYGETPLHWAIRYGKLDIVKLLIEYNADTSVVDGDGNTLLHWAAEYNHPEILQLLLSYNPCSSLLNDDIETALDLATKNDSQPCITILTTHENNIKDNISIKKIYEFTSNSDPLLINEQGIHSNNMISISFSL